MPQSASEILKQPMPIIKYLIPGLLPEGGHVVIGGSSKQGKSYLALEMASCLVNGKPFLGTFPCSPCRLLLVQAEMPASAFIIQRLFPAAKVCQKTALDRFYLEQSTSFRLANITDVARLKAIIDSCTPDIVIIDPLYSIHVGSFNEAGVVNETLQTLNFISVQCHCVIVLVAHFKKSFTTNKGIKVEQDWSDILGSALFGAWADTIITVTPVEENDDRRKLSFTTRWLPDLGSMIAMLSAVPPFYTVMEQSPRMRILQEIISGNATSASSVAKRAKFNYQQTLKFLKNITETNILVETNGEYFYPK